MNKKDEQNLAISRKIALFNSDGGVT